MGSKAPDDDNHLKKSISAGESSSRDAVSIQIASTETQLLETVKEPKEPKKNDEQKTSQQLYQIDKDGLLQDENGHYILDADNKFIILSQEQINTLR